MWGENRNIGRKFNNLTRKVGVEMTNENAIHYLNFLIREYRGITQLITQTKQRLQSLPGEEKEEQFDTLLKGEGKLEGLETIKGRINRELTKELSKWDIWERWMKDIPGIGAWIAGELIILFYYRFIPICKDCSGKLEKRECKAENGKTINSLMCVDCGKIAKEGLLKHKLDFKDFPTISKWWAYMGMHTVDGVKPKRKKGTQSNWSTVGRTICYHIGEEINRQKDEHPYKAFMKLRKEKHARNNTDWKKGHIHNAGKNEVAKLFLAHFWHVARTLEGKPVSEPYAGAIMGHTNIVKPFYWEDESELLSKTHALSAASHEMRV